MLRAVHGFAQSHSLADCERIIEEYVDGTDNGLTRSSMRAACGLSAVPPADIDPLLQPTQAHPATVGAARVPSAADPATASSGGNPSVNHLGETQNEIATPNVAVGGGAASAAPVLHPLPRETPAEQHMAKETKVDGALTAALLKSSHTFGSLINPSNTWAHTFQV